MKKTGFKIVCETYRDGNWELFMVGTDGSPPINLTRTPQVNELYPHVSPDGTKVSFLVDKGEGESTVRSLYYMNLDGTGRTLLIQGARWPCWNADGKTIVYLKQEGDGFAINDSYTRGLFLYDLACGKHTAHVNRAIEHIYNVCCSPDQKWFVATVHGGLGYQHNNLAIESAGMRVVDLKIPGCRPDISPDGKRLAWAPDDFSLAVGDVDFSGPEPRVLNMRRAVISQKPIKVQHADWSPDGKYLAFGRGPYKKGLRRPASVIGVQAPGWDICVADANATNRWVAVTTDALSNKEPDWVPLPRR